MNTRERVALKRKAHRYDMIIRWGSVIAVVTIVMLVTGWTDAIK